METKGDQKVIVSLGVAVGHIERSFMRCGETH